MHFKIQKIRIKCLKTSQMCTGKSKYFKEEPLCLTVMLKKCVLAMP